MVIFNKKIKVRAFISSAILLVFSTIVYGQMLCTVPKDIITARLHCVVATPESFLTWSESVPGIFNYSQEIVELQKNINRQSDEIVISSCSTDTSEWTAIEFEPITPYTWKWVDMEVAKEDSTIAQISLRRPIWWIIENKADRIGNKFLLDIPEMGINARQAIVTAIRTNQLDTRFWTSDSTQPITGKFTHEANGILLLYFDGEHKPLGVTATHRIWSADRKDWVEASQLVCNENVKTYGNKIVKLLWSRFKKGREKVYNLEVYRHHTYFVSGANILVHNHCLDSRQLKHIVAQSRIPRDSKQAGLLDVKPGQGHVNRSKMNRIYDEILVNPDFWRQVDPTEGPIVIHRYNDGKMILMNGHHRYLALSAASKVEGFKMPDLNDRTIMVIKDFNLPSAGRRFFEWDKLAETRDIK